jgi:hypothetical protein
MTLRLVHELRARGLNITCLDARHAGAALKMQMNKTDQNDAEGLALVRVDPMQLGNLLRRVSANALILVTGPWTAPFDKVSTALSWHKDADQGPSTPTGPPARSFEYMALNCRVAALLAMTSEHDNNGSIIAQGRCY